LRYVLWWAAGWSHFSTSFPPGFDFTPGQLVTTILWEMSPGGVLNAVIYGLDEAVWRRRLFR
jgi:hypothetical protein